MQKQLTRDKTILITMKRFVICALLAGMALAATAQTSLDLVSRAQLRQQRLIMKQEAKGNYRPMKFNGETPASGSNVFGMIKLADGSSAG